jgi:hypothetical protein
MISSTFKCACSIGAMALALATGAAGTWAQTTDKPADSAQQPPAADIIVTGFRSSLQKGLTLKREAVGVRDSIVAEDIGKFPEQNVADSCNAFPASA